MADTPQGPIAAARAQVAREARKARAGLWLEQAARALWPLWALVAAFLGLALLGAPQALPFWAHVALLSGFGAGALWLARGAWRGWRSPTGAEALALLDRGAADQPVAALEDALAAGAGDASARGVWAAHQARMAARAMAARAPAPDLRVSDRDRFALRHAAALALAAGVMAQLGDGGARLAEALVPVAGAAAAVAQAPAPSIEAWASPPLHTRIAPLYLTERIEAAEAIVLPVGSEITLRVFDATEAPALSGAAADATAFQDQGGGAWSVTVPLARSGALEVAGFGGWRFEAIADESPLVAFTEAPSGARSGALQFGFEASDDYGVTAARATIALDADAAGPRGLAPASVFEPVEFALPLPLRGAAESTAETVVEDLTENPWAGLPVILTLIVEDGAGQEGRAEARLTLPGRRFIDPLARAIIEQRRDLAWSTEAAPRVRDVLEAVSAYPDDVFEDHTAYLSLRAALRRLGYAIPENRVAAETPGVVDLLWRAALRIEEGDLSDAERRLREIQQELSDALERGAGEDEIAALMDELREALQDYLRQLAQEAMRNQAEGQQPPPMDPGQTMSQQDLMDMLDRLEEAMKGGMEEMARQMLQQLQQMLENLQMAQPGQQGQPGQGDPAMQALQDMIGQQQGLADRSFDALRQGREGQPGEGQPGQQGQGQQGQGQQGQQGQGQGQPGQQQGRGQGQGEGRPGGPDLGAIARDQEGLRQLLDDLRQGLQGGPGGEALDRAEGAMGAARDALEGGDPDGALQDQVEALDALREGAQAMAREMQNQPGQAQQAGRDGQAGDVRDEDPFGRPTASDGPLDGASVRVPDASVMKRARELMDEIRRRAGDRSRAPEELQYLDRLLDRF